MMNTHTYTNRFVAVTLASLLALSTSACSDAGASNETPATQEQAQVARIPVATQTVVAGEITSSFKSTATLEARDEADVTSKATGIIESIMVEEGDYVVAGQILAHMRDDEYRIQVAQARAELNSIKQELKRVKDMAERDMISADAYDKLRFQADMLQAKYDMAALNLAETEIRAPISGYVAYRYVKPGNLVRQYEQQKLFHIVASDVLQSNVYLPERELQRVKVGQTAELQLTALNNQSVTATVARISPVVDTQSGTFKVVLHVDNQNNSLKPGMFAHVNLNYATRQNTVTVPRYAVQSLDNQHSVFTVDADGVAHKVDVQIGFEDETHLEIINGLSVGDAIVISGQANLKDAALVEVIRSEQQS
ncbi:efflux RND transporter periplasmic adaptor subunit [Pseudidiomarina andamanensis]|uniref:Efflux RND transporter periplasmic adaptor subunit n=1 Tax=Pseudidiomarina andamanensis TaxID=1940690 RepID=A0AA92ILH4_9GAMM|nr:efflux RND transporter periplasmic adaptor subunit [Pseudidiomarina andamanensis]MDS0218563.1 efflux RND transporter periplasmic adaptor subunit [Pseudidiomarina andamanensis]QGT95431.1 efflux RND transporter periplasmic adaptor subunit [Pseudidiomarina andamanensis]